MSLSIKSIKSLVPLLDRIVVKRFEPTTKTASGIFIPTNSGEKQIEGTVLAVGKGAIDREGKTLPMNCQTGDKVLLPSYGGQNVKVGEEEFQIFRDSEIIAKIRE